MGLHLGGSLRRRAQLARIGTGACADNPLGRATAASVIVNEANRRFFEPAAPRGWSVWLSWRQP